MDGGKDIQKVDYLAKILDGYVIRTNPFGRNVSGERAYRRAERVISALHILTNHVPAQEPSRTELRRISIEVLSNILAFRDEMRTPTSTIFHSLQSAIRELISLVRLLSVSGHVSVQNANIVSEALDELGNFLVTSQRSTLTESILFSKDDLMGASDLARFSGPETLVMDTTSKMSDKRVNQTKDINSVKDLERTDSKRLGTNEVDIRSQAILGILKSQGVLGIKDISSNLPEYSEKMIQRELASLVSSGRIKKTGLKRWSRYEIV